MKHYEDIRTLLDTFDKLEAPRAKMAIGQALRILVNVATSTSADMPKREPHIPPIKSDQCVFTQEEIDLLKQGRKIEVVKSVRARRSDMDSLVKTKNFVEEHMGPYYVAPKSVW